MSAFLALASCLAIAAPGDRFFAGEKAVASVDALGAPPPIVARIQEVEAELPAFAGRLSFTWTNAPADVLMVTTIEPTPAAAHLRDALAAYGALRDRILPPVPAGEAPAEPDAETPWQPIALSAPTTVLRLDRASAVRFETPPVLNRSREPIANALFDVETTQIEHVLPDADDDRPGYQLKTDDAGVLAVPVAAPKIAEPHVALLRVTAVKNPRVTAAAELHLSFSDSPHFLTIFLLHDAEDEYDAVLDYLVRKYPQGNSWASRPGDAKVAAKKRSAYFFAYPESVVIPDRAKSKKDEKWVTKNQLVHQVAHPILYEYFGPLPHWLEEGIAWDLEDSLTHSVRAFCGFEGFVYDADNVGWMDKIKNVTTTSQLALTEVFDYHGEPIGKRPNGTKGESTFDVVKYAKSLAVVRCLEATEPHREFPAFLGAIAAEWRAKGQIPGARQLEILKEHYGANVEANVLAFIKKGTAPPRR
jgi:hypothetical protein